MTDEAKQEQLTVPYEQYNKAITAMFYLFNFAIDAARESGIDLEGSMMKLVTDKGELGETTLANMFVNVDKLIHEAVLSEGFEFGKLDDLVEPKQVEVVAPKLTLLQ